MCLPIGRRRHGFGLMIVEFAIILGLTCFVVLPAHASVPSSYDPREAGLVSGECDQAPWGMCWDFAGMMALESYLVTNGLADAGIDLSEEAVPWHVLAICREQMGAGQAFGWTVGRGTRDDSGYAAMMTGYFMSWLGPNLERDIPYYRGSDKDPMGAYPLEERPAALDSASKPFQVTDIVYFENPTRDEVKEAVLSFGGVATGCNLSLDCYREDTAALWYPAPEADPYVNHAVCIVGWNDSFPRTSFQDQEGNLPASDGAWLVKNSERSDGVAAYLWVFYEDGAVLTSDWFNPIYAVAGARTTTDRYVYRVDDLGASTLVSSKDAEKAARAAEDALSDGGGTLTCANVYDFAESERIAEVMFMSMAKGAAYRLFYLPVDDTGAPVLDESRMIELACGVVEHAGYTTVELGDGAVLPSGSGALVIELASDIVEPSLGADASVTSMGLDYSTSRVNGDRSFYLVDGDTVPTSDNPNMPVKFVLRAYGAPDETGGDGDGSGEGGGAGESGGSAGSGSDDGSGESADDGSTVDVGGDTEVAAGSTRDPLPATSDASFRLTFGAAAFALAASAVVWRIAFRSVQSPRRR